MAEVTTATPDRITTWPRLLGTLLLALLLITGVAGMVTVLWAPNPAVAPERFVGIFFVGSAVGELAALGLLFVLLRRRGLTLRELGLLRRPTNTALVLAILIALVYVALTAAGVPAVWEHALAPTGLKLLSVVTAVLVVGVVEEVIFRGYVISALHSMGHGRVLQVLVSALVFGLAHPTAPINMLFTFGLGIGLAVVYLIGNRSLIPVIAAHMLVNLLIEPGLYLTVVEYF